MTLGRWTDQHLNGFHAAAQSLKLYRRAELQGDADGASLIGTLYVDPLPHDHVLQTMLKPNTTFLTGRKGTGKSTIFQRVQHELRKKSSYASAYIDIKTVYESSQVDQSLLSRIGTSDIFPRESLEKLLLHRAFLKAVITEIKEELKNRIERSLWDRLKNQISGSLEELFEGLDNLLEEADDDKFISILAVKRSTIQSRSESSQEAGGEAGIDASIGQTPQVKGSISTKEGSSFSMGEEREYADVLMHTFDIKEFILRLRNLLKAISVEHLYIFVDDFSELPEEAMTVVVQAILAPLNNWSEELIKFKVAAYPGRVYYGSIDKTKIDEINLDLYRLYGTADVSAMEDKAIDFTRRLVERRLHHYCGCDASAFMETKDEEVWRLLFYATMGNPRNLGYVLYFLYESHLIYGRSIGATAIRDASRRYYEEKLEPYFAMNKFLHEDFLERSSVYSLKELLEAIVNRARELRRHRGSAVMRDLPGRPPTSHFHVVVELENLLSTLELNFFLTKYYEMSDRDGRKVSVFALRKVSVFALNYGLCEKYTIEFGRPSGKREYRLYFVERIFDYTPILNKYMRVNQEIVCDNCQETYDLDKLEALRLFSMQCPNCRVGTCQVINLSKKYESVLQAIEPDLLLPRTELGILHTLKTEKKPLFARNIAEELDCSYQLVGKRGKFLDQRGLVSRDENEQGRRRFRITDAAEKSYFERSSSDDLDVT